VGIDIPHFHLSDHGFQPAFFRPGAFFKVAEMISGHGMNLLILIKGQHMLTTT
jgi:hypothetical protein